MKRKIALITGASSGIGLMTAMQLIEEGYIVYGCARRVERMESLKNAGGRILALDVTNEDSMKQCVDTIIKTEGRIDVLVNAAGFGLGGSIEEIPMEEVRRQYEVNVFGLGRMIQLVLPYMRKQNRGKIVNVGSMGGRFASPFCGWYHSTKYAVEAISDSLRMELNGKNIDVIIIEPGLIKTNWGVIAADSIRKYSGEGDYKKAADSVIGYYENRYEGDRYPLSEPSFIANVIVKSIKAKNPKTRYLTGYNAKLFIFLKTVFPDKLFQKIACTFMK